MDNLIIIGAGGFAREIYWQAQMYLGFDSEWTVKGFLDGDVKLSAEEYAKLPGEVTILGDIVSYVFNCAIGTPAVRKKLIKKVTVGKYTCIMSVVDIDDEFFIVSHEYKSFRQSRNGD